MCETEMHMPILKWKITGSIHTETVVLHSSDTFFSTSCSAKGKVHSFPINDLHISLSRTVPVPFHWIEPLAAALKDQFSKYKPFFIGFSQLAYYSNDEGTR